MTVIGASLGRHRSFGVSATLTRLRATPRILLDILAAESRRAVLLSSNGHTSRSAEGKPPAPSKVFSAAAQGRVARIAAPILWADIHDRRFRAFRFQCQGCAESVLALDGDMARFPPVLESDRELHRFVSVLTHRYRGLSCRRP